MLKLTIENFDQLPDGGPLAYEVNSRGFDIGRDQYLDWTLPDDSRFISGKHCEVRYYDNGYWLYDISTNGTFVNRSSRRVQSPYQLMNGDRLEIGDYVIGVEVSGAVGAAGATGAQSAPARQQSGDLWAGGENPPPPIDRKDLMAPQEKNVRAGGFLDQVAQVPDPIAPAGASPGPVPTGPAGGKDPWGVTGIDSASLQTPPVSPTPVPGPQEVTPRPQPVRPQPARAPMNPQGALQDTEAFAFGGNQPAVSEQPAPAPVAAPVVPEPEQVGAPPAAAGASDFVRQFAIGANIPPESLDQLNPDDLAHELGSLFNIICTQLMQLLSARAAAKSMARSGQRTMIQQTENNPLKFMPSAEEAIRTMLTSQTASYLGARDTMERSFADLQVHQVATYSAMQHAIRELMDDLSPEAIAKAGGGKKSLLGGGKGKLWEAYEKAWNEKADRYENGMLDAFLVLFSEHYERNSRS